MKQFLLSLAVVVAVAVVAHSTPVLVGGSALVVNNTSANCSSAVAFSSAPQLMPFTVTHNGLASTNDIKINVSNTVDNVNFTYAYTWYPTFTNAGTEVISSAPVTNYCRATVITTNSQSMVINYGY